MKNKLSLVVLAGLLFGCNPEQEIIGNLTPKQDEKSHKWGYVDERGVIIVPYKYDIANPFSEGMARVWLNWKNGYINERGKVVIPLKYKDAKDFSEGLAGVYIESFNYTGWGYIERTGKVVIRLESKYSKIGDFSEGFARVVSDDNLYGFIDTTGKIVVTPKYEEAGDFSEGLVWVKFEGKFGYIDKTDKIVIPIYYSYAADFSNGVAIVVSPDNPITYNYINKTGESPLLSYMKSINEYRMRLNKSSRSLGSFNINSPYIIVDGNNIEEIYLPSIFDNNEPIPFKELKTLIVKYDYPAFSQGYSFYAGWAPNTSISAQKTITSYGAYIIYFDIAEKKCIGHDIIRGKTLPESTPLDGNDNEMIVHSLGNINEEVKSRIETIENK